VSPMLLAFLVSPPVSVTAATPTDLSFSGVRLSILPPLHKLGPLPASVSAVDHAMVSIPAGGFFSQGRMCPVQISIRSGKISLRHLDLASPESFSHKDFF
jgi:hypothetical protein